MVKQKGVDNQIFKIAQEFFWEVRNVTFSFFKEKLYES